MKTIREVVDLTVGTHKVGDLKGVSYTELVKIFGLPTFWPEDNFDGKVNFEWVIQMGDVIFTVYDWKTFDEEYTKNELDRWSIGGKNQVHVSEFIEEVNTRLNRL